MYDPNILEIGKEYVAIGRHGKMNYKTVSEIPIDIERGDVLIVTKIEPFLTGSRLAYSGGQDTIIHFIHKKSGETCKLVDKYFFAEPEKFENTIEEIDAITKTIENLESKKRHLINYMRAVPKR
jgi:hypothetical protein